MKKIIFTALVILFSFLSAKSYSQLNGTYIVGSGGDYSDIFAAVSALMNQGVNGPVNFKFKTGNYSLNFQPIKMDSIIGASAVNTVTFESLSGISTDVHFDSDNKIFIINNSDFLTFKNLRFYTEGNVFTFYGNVQDLTISNCIIESGLENCIVSNAVHNNLFLTGNSIGGSWISESIFDSPSGISSNIVITGNYFNAIRCIRISRFNSVKIESNYIKGYSNPETGLSGRGVYLSSCSGNVNVSKNTFRISGSYFNLANNALSILSSSGANTLISNNFFSGVSETDLIYASYSNNLKVLNNTFYTDYGTPLEVFHCQSAIAKNNIYYSKSPTQPDISFKFSTYTSDYNNYKFSAPYLAYIGNQVIYSLSQLKNLTQMDSHSVNLDVKFVSTTQFSQNLHLDSSSIGDTLLWGTPLSEITEDIDGDPRDPLHPYMGADEPVFVKLTLKTFLQGRFNQTSNTQTGDTVKVYLRNSIAPYNIVDSAVTYSPSSGSALYNFKNTPNGNYYIVIKHRNSIETWSKSGGIQLANGQFSNYDFTTSAFQAFGNNQILKGSKYCIYSGDVNQDEIIDAADMSLIENDANNSATGYLKSDINGDLFADATDLSVTENNVYGAVILIRP